MSAQGHHDEAHAASEAELLELLTSLGTQRASEERRGGALWAEFGDWCWAMDLVPTVESLDLFAADRSTPLTGRQLEHLLALAGGDQR